MKAFEKPNVMISQSKISPKVVSGWHHHGTRELYGFIVSGRLQLESHAERNEVVEVNPGDFFHIPVGLVHRDINPDNGTEALVSTILVGAGPAVVNVESPERI